MPRMFELGRAILKRSILAEEACSGVMPSSSPKTVQRYVPVL
jgi:hypothetical protein